MSQLEVDVRLLIDVDRADSFDRASQRSVSGDAAEEALMRLHREIFDSLAGRLAQDGWHLRELGIEVAEVVPTR